MRGGLDIRFLPRIADLDAAQWDALRGDDNPFVAHAFLDGLERHDCLRRSHGWTAHHLAVFRDGKLVAAAPCYLKTNSHGEFVFDHGWAEAYARHGLDYYPKLLCAAPYSPVPGPRLLTGGDAGLHAVCLDALRTEADTLGLSSAHINFHDEALHDHHWLPRSDWQFHWHNRDWQDFDAFLAALSAKKRKNIRQERSAVYRAGIRFRRLHGDEASAADLAAMHDFYALTFAEKGNLPVLTPAFLQHLAQTMPRRMLLILAEHEGRAVAGALCLRSANTLYGRYWGSEIDLPGLHFETCYYQGIEYCLEHGLARFEPGAQGEHKVARGFLPVATHSRHFIADPRFRAAIAHALHQEQVWLSGYHERLMAHSPYRHDDTPSSTSQP